MLNTLCTECNISDCYCLDDKFISKDCHISDIIDNLSCKGHKSELSELGQSNTQHVLASESLTSNDINSSVSSHLNDSHIVTQSMRPSPVRTDLTNMHDLSILVDKSLVSSINAFVDSSHVLTTHSIGDINVSVQPSHLSNTSLSVNDQPEAGSLTDLGFKCKGFRIGHLNIQGLSNKTD